MGYPQLRVMTDFSFRRGASTISSLLASAKAKEVPVLAITDLASMSGVLEFSDYASSKGIQPIIGCDLNILNGVDINRKDKLNGHVVLLAMNNIGYINICKILEHAYTPITIGNRSSLPVDPFVSIDYLCEHNEGVIVLSGVKTNGLGYALATHSEGDDVLQHLLSAFGNRFYIEMCRTIGQTEFEHEDVLFDLADNAGLPICATIDIQYASEADASAWHLLRASRDGLTIIIKEDGSVEADNPGLYIPTSEEFEMLFEDIPDAIENTVLIADRCSFMVEKKNPILPNYPVPEGETTESHLLNESLAGLKERMKGRDSEYPEYETRLRFEIDVINRMGFPGYFLIVSDFIRWAKSNDIPVGPGRGSGAGSVVAWALLITDVDPIFHGLLFERFLNPERVSMPDFDVDFCTNRRGEVIDYVRQKYGEDHVCMIATFGKIMAKTAVDDVQRCVISDAGFALGRGDASILKSPFQHLKTANMSLKKAVSGGESDIEKEQCGPFLNALAERKDTVEDLYPFLNASIRIEGLSRNQSQHAAGVVIGDRPLSELFPIIRDEKNMSTMSAFSGKYTEMAGGVKFDFLGLKNLTIIDEAMKIAKKIYGSDIIDPRNLTDFDAPEHKELYEMVCAGKTVGVFQLSSPGMSKTLSDVGPTCFADIVAIVSLYRPGPMAIIPDYAARKHGTQEVVYPVEKFTKHILEPTYGFMVYQEQVMQIAMSCAGYTLGGADLLRRAMGKKIRAEMEKQRSVFVDGCSKNDITEKEANDLFDTISKFADYGFNKSHAVAYSIIAWQTMYLKLHYPECFYSALIALSPDNIPRIVDEMKTSKPAIYLNAPDVNKSFVDAWPINKTSISCGLAIIPTMKNISESLVNEREKNGPFKDIVDFGFRAGKILPTAAYKYLAEVGALDCFWDKNGEPIRSQLAALAEWFAIGNRKVDERQGGLFDMFSPVEVGVKWPKRIKEIPSLNRIKDLPDIALDDLEEWKDRDIRAMKSLGFWINGHPINSKIGLLANFGCRPLVSWNIFMRIMGVGNINNQKVPLMIEEIEEDYTYAKEGIPSLKIKGFDGLNIVYLRYFHNITRGKYEEYSKASQRAKEKYKNLRTLLDDAKITGASIVGLCNLKYANSPGRDWREQTCKATLNDVLSIETALKDVSRDWTIVMSGSDMNEYQTLYDSVMTYKSDKPFTGTINIVHNGIRKNITNEDFSYMKFHITDDDIIRLKQIPGVVRIYCPIEEEMNEKNIFQDDIIDLDDNTSQLDYRVINFEKLLKENKNGH